MEHNHSIWKISMAVWLPVIVAAILIYAVAYGISYKKAKDKQSAFIAAVDECKSRGSSQNVDYTKVKPTFPVVPAYEVPIACLRANTDMEHGFLYLPKFSQTKWDLY